MTFRIYLKGYPHPGVRDYLSENDFELRFSAFQKFYYRGARRIIPIPVRQWLQAKYVRNTVCRSNFIWPALVDLLKEDQQAWEQFVRSLYPSGYKTAVVLTHDVETQKGFDFIPTVIELERALGFKSSWNIVPYKYSVHEEVIRFIKDTGNEIGIHGYNHDGTLYYSRKRFSQRAVHINKAIKKYGAFGFRSPQVHRNLNWLQDLDVLYDASCFDYDPYQPFPGGTGCIWPFIAGKFVELPYTIPQDHVLFYSLKEKDITIWKAKTKWIVANQGVVLPLTHPDYLQERDHLKKYEEYLAYLRDIPQAWHCLPRELAEWYVRLPDSVGTDTPVGSAVPS